MSECLNCSRDLTNTRSKYCSNQCQIDQQYEMYINNWKRGEESGSRGVNAKNLSGHVIRYMHEKYGAECSECVWKGINPFTGKSILEIDHIDGDSENNSESNLRILCPNCHAMTRTYKNLNKGHGRQWRKSKYIKG